MIVLDLILILMLFFWYIVGFWCGKKYGSAKAMVKAFGDLFD